jgi:predicted RNA-binding Zn ribbon-like protein
LVRRTSGGVLLRGVDGAIFRFDPGALCLEFALTGGEGERDVFETLHAAVVLRRWARDALGFEIDPVGEADLVAAKQLREAIWQCGEARALGRSLPAPQIGIINRSAAEPPPVPRIDREGRLEWVVPVTVSQVMSTLARDAVDLVTGGLADRIRQCEAIDCGLLFADTSRPGRRRWCSMERCGNRAKVRAYRERRHQERTTHGGEGP